MSHFIQSATAKFPLLTQKGVDHKAWAKQIFHRIENGDRSLSVIQINFAKEAMEPTKK